MLMREKKSNLREVRATCKGAVLPQNDERHGRLPGTDVLTAQRFSP